MFTGIIQDVGKVIDLKKSGTDMQLTITSQGLEWSTVQLGDSIAVNGACLTVTDLLVNADNTGQFMADVSHETLQKTTLSQLAIGHAVNLEKALTLSTPLGGHLVSGHVDGIGQVRHINADGDSTRYYFSAPNELLKFIAIKGSITIEGISLTVNGVSAEGFDVTIISHTADKTTIAALQPGDRVNLEIDLIARYIARMMEFEKPTV
ncbi:riboflavin synthase [Ostreibacterium oceani]|uniref:Riboflavin synthase n=1 Tax=Ostreibacterium oceani TaxID=2654998 RepID=A0A6N7EW23_9GAMM|nr:riboflavin synthase [Ostreibacterium oceani]MPV85287.1 riboflavin synthase [Ostreibacterium oceani]